MEEPKESDSRKPYYFAVGAFFFGLFLLLMFWQLLRVYNFVDPSTPTHYLDNAVVLLLTVAIFSMGYGVTKISSLYSNKIMMKEIKNMFDMQKSLLEKMQKNIDIFLGNHTNTLIQKKPVVFLSYSHNDSNNAYTIRNSLSLYEITVLSDIDSIRDGESWKDAIRKRIDNANIFMPIISKNYSASHNCQQEVGIYLGRNKAHTHSILPVSIDETDPVGFISDLETTGYDPDDAGSMSILAYIVYAKCRELIPLGEQILSGEQGELLNLFVYGTNQNTKIELLNKMVRLGMNKFLATTLGDMCLRSDMMKANKELHKAVMCVLDKNREYLPLRLRDDLGLHVLDPS